ncbi:bifunctional (p)ppGpp synthetase/guanosine-3',5'-bis(diphosphate) 3'-pyrophosphohydrolase [Candidatus Tisiphia endosymbiont of Nedyus quadrimaculatus]|uniref:bifunctional (p)ppGpp synthetase/guanosine-3',5'-bis(diphosphate) 3'-pyrophosphohydrolase n=1 Tax=Candidatus Tisiphia endosymbiont of Nedyus quadrimaculatus TaxID=3139332 RepID=UPI00345E74FB
MQSQDTNDLRKIADIISTKLSENDIAAKTYYRLKDPCSALNKMILKTNELTDLVAFRFIVDKLEYCYKVLDIIRGIYSVKIAEKKNYIDYPKDNGYRSLHIVTSVGNPRRDVEMQVRTNEMHDIAEFGIANHNEYKKTQAAKIRELLPSGMLNIAGINTELNKAYDIFSQFNWTIQELIAYEQAIENIYRIYQDQDSLRKV